ncbi:MAG: hypothetical protein QM747_01740 [Nocardioides sp.]
MRVIEGWHPSDPGNIGYNLLLDGEWVGTYRTLEEAADSAALSAGMRSEMELVPEA